MSPGQMCHQTSPSTLEAEIVIGKSKRSNLPGINQVLAEVIDVEGKILHLEFHRLINWY